MLATMEKLIPGISEHKGAALFYLDHGHLKYGFLLRDDEFVTSLRDLEEAKKKAGLPASGAR
ncbi:hypothetical protein ACQHF0_005031 [Salmonella enterica]